MGLMRDEIFEGVNGDSDDYVYALTKVRRMVRLTSLVVEVRSIGMEGL